MINDFGIPNYFEPEAIGEPGNRQFRLIAKSGDTTASLWIERIQLQELMETIQEIYVSLTGNLLLHKESEALPKHDARTSFPALPDISFQIGPMSLGIEDDSQNAVFLAAPLEVIEQNGEQIINEEADPAFRVILPPDKVEQFIIFAEQILAAGRPRCPNCGQPLDKPEESHVCAKKNGHYHLD